MVNPQFVIFGAFLVLLGSVDYLVSTLRGKTRPNKVTWLLWALAPLTAFYAEIKQGVGLQSLATFIVGFVPLIILIGSFFNKKARWKIGKLDISCGILAFLGIILWYITKIGNMAIFFSILADSLAAFPTIVKSYQYPETERSTIYFFAIINGFIALLANTKWNFEHIGFPLYIFFVNLILFVFIQFKLGKKLCHETK